MWQSVLGAEPRLEGWVARGHTELHVARLPRSAWPIVAGAVARALTNRRKSAVILVQDPERFAEELRLWLNGQPAAYVFAEVRVSFLDRPPAFDESVNRRLEALAALASVVEERGQFSLRGGILDVFPSAADAPVRAEWVGDAVETLRLFDPDNQRSVMAMGEVTIRTGRELLIGPERGAGAVERLRGSVSLESLRGDVRSEWEDELARLGAGAAFAGVEFYAAYLDPSRPSLLDHVPEDAVVIDFEPARQRADARTLLDETAMLAAAEAGGGELPRQFKLPTIDRADDFGARPHLFLTSAEGAGDAIDLGWFEGEPLVGQPRALAGFAARGDVATIVFATEQDERLRALLDEAGVESALAEPDLDLDLELKPGLHHSSADLAAGCSHPAIGCRSRRSRDRAIQGDAADRVGWRAS
ncbi:MAG: hypothetical protein AUI15_42170 [Actinobacteria bacterium 13_2_20CM_2_66_6]|nr:MAG: hypothetical protein AUI15_42170 [Actinobacteria bacterium 13_2_20CM_2_66_6]